MPTARERAAAGATLLDQVAPGWYEKVKIRQLDLSSGCRCVLAQLEERQSGNASYAEGLGRLLSFIPSRRVRERRARELGFDYAGGSDYPLLTEAWRDEIRKRRNKVSA